MFLSFWTDFTFWSLAAPVNFPVSTPTPPRPPKCTLVLNNVSSHWIPFYLLFCLAALYHMIWVQINHNEISNWTLRVFTSYTWQLRIVCCFKSHECFRPPWLVTFRQKNQQSRMWTNWMQKKKKKSVRICAAVPPVFSFPAHSSHFTTQVCLVTLERRYLILARLLVSSEGHNPSIFLLIYDIPSHLFSLLVIMTCSWLSKVCSRL